MLKEIKKVLQSTFQNANVLKEKQFEAWDYWIRLGGVLKPDNQEKAQLLTKKVTLPLEYENIVETMNELKFPSTIQEFLAP